MNSVWVINASPIIFLCKLQKINLLESFGVNIIIPQAVSDEIIAGPHDDEAKKWILSYGKKFVIDTGAVDKIVAHWDLGSGESSVISYCFGKINHYAILDDLAARKCTEVLSIKVKGTLGVLLLAKKNRLIPELKPLLDQFKENHCRIENNLYELILRNAGEL